MKDTVTLVESRVCHGGDNNTIIIPLDIEWTCSCGDKIYADSGVEKVHYEDQEEDQYEIWNRHRIPINYLYCPSCNLEAEIHVDTNENLEIIRIYDPDEDLNTTYEDDIDTADVFYLTLDQLVGNE